MSTQLINPDQIKASVREHYGQAIQRGSCCGGSCGCDESTEVALYGTETLAELPQGLETTSFGCGNPLALATLQPGEVVLDLGSGGGLDVLLAARRVGAQGYVYGLDMTDEMLAVARRNAERAGAQNVEFLQGDIEAIPLPAASVDVIISNCVINLAPDKGQVLSDAFRVLRPGGRLAVSDIVIDGTLDGLPLDEAQIRAGLNWAGCIAGALTAGQYRTLLAEAGFVDLRIEVVQRYRPDELLGDAPAALASLPPEAQAALVGRFTSCSVSGRKPVLQG